MELPKCYRAYQYDNYGPPAQELKLRTAVQLPHLGTKQVRIKVVSAAINPADYGLMVQPVGSEAKRLKVGDQVYVMTHFTACGTMADFVAVDEDLVALKSRNLSFDQAASIPLVGLTSYQMLLEHCKLQKGEMVLILGGSSATGILGVQLAHAVGAHVITTTSVKNGDFVKALGADRVIDYHTQKWADVLEPHSVDVIYDCGMETDAWNTVAKASKSLSKAYTVSITGTIEPSSRYFVSSSKPFAVGYTLMKPKFVAPNLASSTGSFGGSSVMNRPVFCFRINCA